MANPYELTRADADGNVRAAGGCESLADGQASLLRAVNREAEYWVVCMRRTISVDLRPFAAEIRVEGNAVSRYRLNAAPVYEVIPDVLTA